jgi:rhodanese-related sulfurtransferase
MQIPEVDPRTAHERLTSEPRAIYVDVRTVTEYEQGHPTGAWNLPIMSASPMGMRPNPEFQGVAAKVLPKDTLLVVGCKSGQRSFMACRMFLDMGFTHVVNVGGGFGGSVDPTTGRVVTPGWMACGLPTSRDTTPGKGWEDLKAEARGRE